MKYFVTNNETKAFIRPSHLLRDKGDTANFDLEKPNFCLFLNLCFSFNLLVHLIQNNDFTGEKFAIYFYLFKGCSFSINKNSNLVKIGRKVLRGF